jgi:DNA-binding response OmpR family regulator
MAQPQGLLPDSVLLVDDEPSVIDVLTRALTRNGLTVKAVKTAEEAFRLLDSETFGAVVTDKNLPQRSGLDVVRAAREKQPYCACIVITGFVSAASVLEALQLGANDYLLKPFDDVALVVQRIKQAIAAQRTEAERAALVEMIRDLAKSLHEKEDSLRAKEKEVFQSKTELDLFTSVMELRIEEATEPLQRRVALLESDLRAWQERRAKLKQRLAELGARVLEVAATAGEAGPVLQQVAEALDAEAGALE